MPERSCSACGGRCPTPEACLLPIELRPIRRRLFVRRRWLPTTPEAWARLIGAVLGTATAAGLALHFQFF